MRNFQVKEKKGNARKLGETVAMGALSISGKAKSDLSKS